MLEGRHQVARLQVLAGGDPGGERAAVVGQEAGAERQAAADVRQVRAELTRGRRAAHRMAGAAVGHEEREAARELGCWRRSRRQLLRGEPCVEFRRGMRDDVKRHIRVLGPAVLGALAAKDAGALGLHPQDVDAARDQVELAGKIGHPEAMQHVGRSKPELDVAADRDVHLVRGGQHARAARIDITDAPPPHLADDFDSQRLRFAAAGKRTAHAQRVDQQRGQRDDREHDARADDERAAAKPCAARGRGE